MFRRSTYTVRRRILQGRHRERRSWFTFVSKYFSRSQKGQSSQGHALQAKTKLTTNPGLADLRNGTVFTNQLEAIIPTKSIATYRVMNELGEVVNPDWSSSIPNEKLLKIYKTMSLASTIDNVLYDAQRQGRISFYMPNLGEYAASVSSMAALEDTDEVMLQYRELGACLWRGLPLQQVCDQCCGNMDGNDKGRQMPVHYGSSELKLHTVSSTLATQMPQASGIGYALKREGQGRVIICYFGEGAASEGDAHAAFGLASTLRCNTIFFCRNNGYAISTPVDEQYAGDGIASRAPGYGMPSFRVDGNDFLAVYEATALAREICSQGNKAVMVEAMTYRGGDHSTSDDSSRYRSKDNMIQWATEDNPVHRARKYLINQGLWTEEEETELQKDIKKQVINCLVKAENKLLPSIKYLFDEVYHEKPESLKRQEQECLSHIAKYPGNYPTKKFAK